MARARATTEPSLVLPADAVASTAPQTFPPFPGEYAPGVPVPVASLGMTVDEADRLVRELGLPLESVKVARDGGTDNDTEG